jgi:hypothetical protein
LIADFAYREHRNYLRLELRRKPRENFAKHCFRAANAGSRDYEGQFHALRFPEMRANVMSQ